MVVPFEGASLRALFHVRQSDGAYLGKSKSAARFPPGALLDYGNSRFFDSGVKWYLFSRPHCLCQPVQSLGQVPVTRLDGFPDINPAA